VRKLFPESGLRHENADRRNARRWRPRAHRGCQPRCQLRCQIWQWWNMLW